MIKNCPCCDSPATLASKKTPSSQRTVYRVSCSSCSMKTGDHYDEELALKTWNTRTEIAGFATKVKLLIRLWLLKEECSDLRKEVYSQSHKLS